MTREWTEKELQLIEKQRTVNSEKHVAWMMGCEISDLPQKPKAESSKKPEKSALGENPL